MKKIGILRCAHANEVCTGAGCLNAFFRRTDTFSRYGEDTVLTVFMACNGCGEERPQGPGEDAGILEKLDRLEAEGVDTIHVGACRFQKNHQECSRLETICRMMEERGIEIVKGTHRE